MSTIETTVADPGLLRYILGYLMVGIAWGFTTPFMRKATLNQKPNTRPKPSQLDPWIKTQLVSIWHSVSDLVKQPAYAIPLLINLSGSVMFFVIVGDAGTFGH
jgi:hypothetical protein